MRYALLALLMVSLLFFGCVGSGTPAPQSKNDSTTAVPDNQAAPAVPEAKPPVADEPPSVSQPPRASAVLGTPFQISINQTVPLQGENVSIRLADIEEDSRCPKDAKCIQAGRVVAKVQLVQGAKVLDETSLFESANLGQYLVTLDSVGPEKQQNSAITKPEYSVMLTVSRKNITCADQCGNGKCEEVVCIGTGCPCTESSASCPADCMASAGGSNHDEYSEGGFCGISTNGKCGSDWDCKIGGCSSQVCQSNFESAVQTTCEYKDCYQAAKYGVGCRCISSQCQWKKA